MVSYKALNTNAVLVLSCNIPIFSRPSGITTFFNLPMSFSTISLLKSIESHIFQPLQLIKTHGFVTPALINAEGLFKVVVGVNLTIQPKVPLLSFLNSS